MCNVCAQVNKRRFLNSDKVDVFKLNCSDLIEWLSTQNIPVHEIQGPFKGLSCTYVACTVSFKDNLVCIATATHMLDAHYSM